ncbi:MAG: sodium-dependent transporter [Ruminococcus sp.]
MSQTNQKRATFHSRIGFIFVAAGCAIGLGNVWKFPYICSQYGGGAFLIIYLLCLLLLGLPILVCEFSIGRRSQRSIARAFEELEPEGTRWHLTKYMGIAGNYLLMMFYTMVTGWMLYYVYLYISGDILSATAEQMSAEFEHMLNHPSIMMLFTAIVILLGIGVCALSLQNGIEKITKYIMSLLILLMVVLVIHSLCLDGAWEGVSFYLKPDLAHLQEQGIGNVTFAAMTQAFFTISVGSGSMEIFGSFLKKERRLTGEAVNVVVLDTLIAIMAGLIIIPACFAYGVQPDSGPSLLFITLPNVFHHMAGGRIWGTCFFLFMSFAAFTTIIAVFENIISMTSELRSWTRKKSIFFNLIGLFVLSMPAVFGFTLLSDIQLLGEGSTIMDFEDFLVSANILPLGSLVFVLFCVRKNGWGWNGFLQEVNAGTGLRFPAKLRIYVTYVIPVIICIIYLKGYYDKFADAGFWTLFGWMCFAVLLLMAIFGICFFSKPKSAKISD